MPELDENKNELNFREATLNDVVALLALEQCVVEAERPFNSAISHVATYYNIEHLIESDNACLLVIEDQHSIVATGYVQIRPSKSSLSHDQHGYLGFMYVSPEYRGQKLNARIIEKLILWAQNIGVVDFYLDVYAENAAAISAYQKVGFEPSMLEMKLHTS